MRRPLLHLAAALSLLLCAAASILWVRSYFVLDSLQGGWVNEPPTSGTYVQAYCNLGAIALRRFDVTATGSPPAEYRIDDGMEIVPPRRWTSGLTERWVQTRYRWLMGFGWTDASGGGGGGADLNLGGVQLREAERVGAFLGRARDDGLRRLHRRACESWQIG